jgi:hypothetical protein
MSRGAHDSISADGSIAMLACTHEPSQYVPQRIGMLGRAIQILKKKPSGDALAAHGQNRE